MGSKTDYLEEKWLDHTLRGTTYTAPAAVYSALFTAIPSDAGGGTEVTTASSGYTRVLSTFSTAGATATGQSANSGAVTFATAAAGYTVVGWALMDAATAGNMLYWATVTTLAIGIGDQATFAVGGIVITED
jgi:hypothetical protein